MFVQFHHFLEGPLNGKPWSRVLTKASSCTLSRQFFNCFLCHSVIAMWRFIDTWFCKSEWSAFGCEPATRYYHSKWPFWKFNRKRLWCIKSFLFTTRVKCNYKSFDISSQTYSYVKTRSETGSDLNYWNEFHAVVKNMTKHENSTCQAISPDIVKNDY